MALKLELFFRQLFALIMKNIMILYARGAVYSTIWTSTYLPILIAIYLSVVLKLYYPTATYGIGDPTPIRSVVDAMNVKPGMLVLLNNASSIGGSIDQVINAVASAPRAAGKQVLVTSSQDEFLLTCRPNFSGSTACFAAAVFQSSPSEGPDGLWNYTIRGAANLGQTTVDVTKNNNDIQLFVLPLQHAIDSAIAALNSSKGANPLPALVNDILFTSITEDAWKLKVQHFILESNINFAAIVWILTIIGVAYRVVSAMAMDRESQMSDLIEAMMPNTQRWQPQAIRLMSTHIAFGFAYSPGWICAGILFKLAYLKHSSMGIAIIGWLLAGGAMTGFALVAGACFRKAHLSSIIAVGVIILLGIVTQIKSKHMSTGTVIITGLLFTPMTFVNFIIFCCRWEDNDKAIQMGHAAPNSPWDVTGGGFWLFFIVQILAYPVIAAIIERYVHGTTVSRSGRAISMDDTSTEPPVVVDDVSKIYQSPFLWRLMLRAFGKKNEPVVAANHLSMTALPGQIMVLVGANGCGKTTILNAIAGLHSVSSGQIRVNGSGGIGICPQKNVLWDSLTVLQHATIFNKLKATDSLAVGNDLNMLIKACGLDEKRKFQSKNLSGGQKRKLQLLMMLTGGSRVCCVDEASGGLDPLSRRKIWDILLSERGKRTVILTTHFLDEAEFLADNMVVMAKGEIKTMGSVSELKSKLGNGYRVQVLTPGSKEKGEIEKFEELETVPDSAQALAIIKDLESKGVKNYQVAGPTIEEVFMKLAADRDAEYEETEPQPLMPQASLGKERESVAASLKSLRGEEVRRRVGAMQQVWVLLRKRWTVFQRSPLPILMALVTPIVAAGLLSILMRSYQNPSCTISSQFSVSSTALLDPKLNPLLAVGPADALTPASLSLVAGIFPNNTLGTGNGSGILLDSIHLVDSFAEYNAYTQQKFGNLTPGGLYLGDATAPPTISIRSDLFSPGTVYSGVFLQNVIDVLLTRVSIATGFTPYDFAWPAGTGDSLQFIFYFGLVMCAAPAFFSLYPCRERVRSVRAMEYSNGVRPLPLWVAYALFDFVNVLISSSLVVIIFATKNDQGWYNIGYFYVVLLLYGLASILLSYVISKVAGSHFASFACAAGGQG
jgi:ATP-binding cassette subfamily A (ABC1) protein 3